MKSYIWVGSVSSHKTNLILTKKEQKAYRHEEFSFIYLFLGALHKTR